MSDIYRPTQAEIYLDNLVHNYQQFETLFGENMICSPIIKADAYGHGAVECAMALMEVGARYFCVSFIDEAIQLRRAGIQGIIIILGYTEDAWVEDLFKYHLTPTVFDYHFAELLDTYAASHGTICDIHVKIDTGMGRVGFWYEDAAAEVERIARLKNINIEGIFSHYSTADVADKSYANLQRMRFDEVLLQLRQRGIEIPIKHMANSAGAIDLDQTGMNLVRLGIVLYGLYPSDEVHHDKVMLKPVMRYTTKISYIKKMKAGCDISYGRTYTTPREMTVGTLIVGYADGYRRALSNKAYVMINGKKAKVIGAVCMDQMMVDLTDVEDAKVGDTAVLFGEDGMSVDEMAKMADTINYEILCGMSKRVTRLYFQYGQVISSKGLLEMR